MDESRNHQLEDLSPEMLELYEAMPGPNVKHELDPGEVEAMLKSLDAPPAPLRAPRPKFVEPIGHALDDIPFGDLWPMPKLGHHSN